MVVELMMSDLYRIDPVGDGGDGMLLLVVVVVVETSRDFHHHMDWMSMRKKRTRSPLDSAVSDTMMAMCTYSDFAAVTWHPLSHSSRLIHV